VTLNRGAANERSQRRRSEILQAAHDVFTARGYRNGSLGEIAEIVGITHQGILHHFGSKERLLVEVLRARDEAGRDEAERDQKPVGAAFLAHLIRTVTLNEQRSGIVQAYTVLSAESVTSGHPAQEWFRARFGVLRDELRQALAQLFPAGLTLDDAALDAGASAIIAVMDGLQVQWLLDPAAVDMPAIVRSVIDSMLAGWNLPALPE